MEGQAANAARKMCGLRIEKYCSGAESKAGIYLAGQGWMFSDDNIWRVVFSGCNLCDSLVPSARHLMNETLVVIAIVAAAICWVALAAMPVGIARKRRHPQENSITILAIGGIFIPVLWFVALAWAVSGGTEPRKRVNSVDRPSGYPGGKRLDFDQKFQPDTREEDQIFGADDGD
jgi:ABC-type proline/glycine betaine transport system permease subunit